MIKIIEINQLSKYHNIGQGLFYSATIRSVDSIQDFKYIIDCGTTSHATNLKKEIEKYLEEQEDYSRLDALIISHFHKDHISGLKQLFDGFSKKNMRIKNFFIPYFSMEKRNYLYLSWYKELGDSEKWVLEFILNPVEYLDKFNLVDNIIFVHPNDSDYSESDVDNDYPKDDGNSFKITGKEVINLNSNFRSKFSRVYNFCDVKFIFMALIEFDFWVKECDSDKLKEFSQEMQSVIGSDPLSESSVEKIMSDENCKNAYKKLQKDFNDTSLCVLISNFNDVISVKNHLKSSSPDVTRYICFGGFKLPYKTFTLGGIPPFYLKGNTKYFGYLFTGDINFAPSKATSLNETYIDFVQHYQTKLKKVKFLSVPHHGSRHSWEYKLLSQCNNPISVVSSARDGVYGHPHYTVVKDIEQYGWAWANESDSITIENSITFSEAKVYI